jgi:hypothetical protein
MAGYRGPGSTVPSRVVVYLVAVALTYAPLALFALLGTSPPGDHLSFFNDWAVAFVFLVSFPTLLILTVTDEEALSNALTRVQLDGVVRIPDPKPGPQSLPILRSWRMSLGVANLLAHIAGLGIGVWLARQTVQTYLPGYSLVSVKFWISSQSGPLPIAYVFQYALTLLYAVITLYVVRSVALSLYLHDQMSNSTIRMLPFHPDKCGGLQPVGKLGLRNQYALSVLGINVILLFIVARQLGLAGPLFHLIEAAVLAYVTLGPIVFMGPLLPFRSGMLRSKAEWINEVQQGLGVEFEGLRARMRAGQITKDDEDLVERLRKISLVAADLPVWPFDARTLRRFMTAYLVPAALSLLGHGLRTAVAFLRSLP